MQECVSGLGIEKTLQYDITYSCVEIRRFSSTVEECLEDSQPISLPLRMAPVIM